MAAKELIQVHEGKNILRITKDSDRDLDELFRAAIGPKDGQIPLSKPMRQRNLPASFFTPPDTGSKSASHSRDSSIDNSGAFNSNGALLSIASPTSPQQTQTNGAASPQHMLLSPQQQKLQLLQRAGLQVVHPRAHSSPATLQQSLSVAVSQNSSAVLTAVTAGNAAGTQATPTTVQAAAAQHMRQMSDIDRIPLPKGWEHAMDQSSGRLYFINHNDKTTTWDDPRLAIQQQQLKQLQLQQLEMQKQQQQLQAAQQLQQNQQQLQQLQLQQQQQQQLPQMMQTQQQSQQPQQLMLNQQQQAQRILVNNGQMIVTHPMQNAQAQQIANMQLGKLPDGWEQRKTEEGEVFFINHNDCSTTWFDPRLPPQMHKANLLTVAQAARPPPTATEVDMLMMPDQQIPQQPQLSQILAQQPMIVQQQQSPQQLQQTQSPMQVQVSTSIQQQVQQAAQHQQVQQQVQQQHQVQQAVQVQHNAQSQPLQSSPTDHQVRVQQLQQEREKLRQRQQEIAATQQRLLSANLAETNGQNVIPHCAITTTGMDPFLGGTMLSAEHHSRQESADSGLGLCPNYSLPNTPDGMLSSDIEERQYVAATDDLGLDALAITSMDFGEHMESDELMPSIPDELACADIHLSDIDAILAGSGRDNWL